MAFCTNCGTKIEAGTKFCPNCGASVEESTRPPKTSPAPKPASRAAAASALEKFLPVFQRNYKVIGAAALAVVILLSLFSRCGGGGSGKEDKFLNQIQDYWTMDTQVADEDTMSLSVPWTIGITENTVQLGTKQASVSMAETEYKDGALYFSAEWYESIPNDGQGPGMRNHILRLGYNKGDDLLILDIELSGKWHTVGEYARAK